MVLNQIEFWAQTLLGICIGVWISICIGILICVQLDTERTVNILWPCMVPTWRQMHTHIRYLCFSITWFCIFVMWAALAAMLPAHG